MAYSYSQSLSQIPLLGSMPGLGQSVTSALGSVSPLLGSLASSALGTSTADLRVRLGALDPSLYNLSSSNAGGSLGGPLGAAISSFVSGTLGSLGGGGSIMAPLANTNGMLFPYSPSITLAQTVDYMDVALVHSNTNYQAYTRTPSVKISVSGKFTVQNQAEGQYALAAIHFLRTASKSHFGELDPQAGLPPPVLLFSGYGNYMFGSSGVGQGLRVILNSHSWSYDENIDTIQIAINNGYVRLPAMFTIQCELTVIQTPTRMRQQFSFQSFASGELMKNSNGWI